MSAASSLVSVVQRSLLRVLLTTANSWGLNHAVAQVLSAQAAIKKVAIAGGARAGVLARPRPATAASAWRGPACG